MIKYLILFLIILCLFFYLYQKQHYSNLDYDSNKNKLKVIEHIDISDKILLLVGEEQDIFYYKFVKDSNDTKKGKFYKYEEKTKDINELNPGNYIVERNKIFIDNYEESKFEFVFDNINVECYNKILIKETNLNDKSTKSSDYIIQEISINNDNICLQKKLDIFSEADFTGKKKELSKEGIHNINYEGNQLKPESIGNLRSMIVYKDTNVTLYNKYLNQKNVIFIDLKSDGTMDTDKCEELEESSIFKCPQAYNFKPGKYTLNDIKKKLGIDGIPKSLKIIDITKKLGYKGDKCEHNKYLTDRYKKDGLLDELNQFTYNCEPPDNRYEPKHLSKKCKCNTDVSNIRFGLNSCGSLCCEKSPYVSNDPKNSFFWMNHPKGAVSLADSQCFSLKE